METSTKKAAKKTAVISPDTRITLAYTDYLLTHGSRPPSVFKFSKDLGINEEDFYRHFGSFDGVEKHIWSNFISRTLIRLRTDEAYAAFSSREKMLTFYYAFFEELKSNRSFVLLQLENRKKLEIEPAFLKDFKKLFENFVNDVIATGKANGDVASRPFIDTRYANLLWIHFGFLLIFWRDDDSAGFEKTDAAIEKSVNLAFDLIGKGAVDSIIDFAKFLYQSQK
jgi:AcrR family transcriptional regulator